jgi:hypothetical protein
MHVTTNRGNNPGLHLSRILLTLRAVERHNYWLNVEYREPRPLSFVKKKGDRRCLSACVTGTSIFVALT